MNNNPGRRNPLSVSLVLASLFGCTVLSTAAQAQTCTEEPTVFVREIGDQVVAVLAGTDLDRAARKDLLRELFMEYVAVEVVGQIVLGRYWTGITDQQRTDYLDAFPRYIASVYASQLSGLDGAEILISGTQSFGDTDELVTLDFRFSDSASVSGYFRIRCIEGDQRLLDAVISGASLIVTKRDEFGSFLRRNDMDNLIEIMRRLD
ncbi:MAG: ABC transporter substrate-binding protein [Alphaproteobacteria bacterium]|nr:ABC transporter substrate-binding protein [Alphaproteobacteria bacterium]